MPKLWWDFQVHWKMNLGFQTRNCIQDSSNILIPCHFWCIAISVFGWKKQHEHVINPFIYLNTNARVFFLCRVGFTKVSDLSMVPQVLELSFGPGTPSELLQVQGLLMQQPGLWDGRPYYKHTAFQDMFLLCFAEGWRLGPLPLALGTAGPGQVETKCWEKSEFPSFGMVFWFYGVVTSCFLLVKPAIFNEFCQRGVRAPVLLSRSPAALPQEIVEPWIFLGQKMSQLPEGSVLLRRFGR